MSQSKLPLRIRVDIRDRFEAPDTPIQKALNTLEGIVGLKVFLSLDWDLLYTALDKNFPDKTTFIPTITDILVTWCDVLATRLEDDRFTSWTESLVGMLEAAGTIKFRIQVSDTDRPTTGWSTENSSFFINFPRTVAYPPNSVSSGFEADFANLFPHEPSAVSTDSSLPLKAREDEWADIDVSDGAPTARFANLSMNAESDRASPITVHATEKLPCATTLPMPHTLLSNMIPYILHVSLRASGKMVGTGSSRSINQGSGRLVGQSSSMQVEQGGRTLVVQGTHGPSLQFLYQYLQRWIKTDHQDARKVPLLRITLQESLFGLGISYDTIVLEPYDTTQEKRGVEMNPTIVLALIENVLGYRCLPTTSAGFWEFKRDSPFK